MVEFLKTSEVAARMSMSEKTLRQLYESATPALKAHEFAPFPAGLGTVRRPLRWPAKGYAEWIRLASSNQGGTPPPIPVRREHRPHRRRSLFEEACG